MKTLQETLDSMDNKAGKVQTLRKHLNAVGIVEWKDITRSKLYDLRDHLVDKLAPNSAKTVMANFKPILNRMKDDIPNIPRDYDKILVAKGTFNEKTFLSEQDLAKIEAIQMRTNRQKYVQNVFLICAYTGLRWSDAKKLTLSNIIGGNLHYMAQKTRKTNAIPLKPGLVEKIAWLQENSKYEVTIMSYNRTVKKMCKDAGLTEEVFVTKKGEEYRGPKWKFITSHSARVSTATDLARRGVPYPDIQQLLQHSSITVTERYIVKDRVHLSDEAMKFFS